VIARRAVQSGRLRYENADGTGGRAARPDRYRSGADETARPTRRGGTTTPGGRVAGTAAVRTVGRVDSPQRTGGRAHGTTPERTLGGLDPDPDATGAERGRRREYERLRTAPYQNIYIVARRSHAVGTVDHQSNQRTPDRM
jgi:hypothetical protein